MYPTASPSTITNDGSTKATPTSAAPSAPPRAHPRYMASCAASGPGSELGQREALSVLLGAEPLPLLHQVALHEAHERDRPAESGGPQPDEIPDQVAERARLGARRRWTRAHAHALEPRELVVEMDGRAHALLPVAEVEALVLRMSAARGILDAGQQARRALQEVGERLDEADRAAGAHHRGLLSEAGLQRAACGVERRAVRIRPPPRRAADDPRLDVRPERRLPRQLAHEQLPRLARVHVRHRPHGDPSAGRIDDLVRGPEDGMGLERDHGEGRPGPDPLVDREALLSCEPHALQAGRCSSRTWPRRRAGAGCAHAVAPSASPRADRGRECSGIRRRP